ncbi:MAG: hypothetical protein DWQ07_24040 [Chloroflexi bacterium]|nr:MAG: hypothetical protein DWQ07_24040 [Chloroflexota bacterium]MBL1194219.1 hypothetical protein [Chloroflexota bacterium]NOH11512.1 hypothetical protein [Chloroflexota bacterium]
MKLIERYIAEVGRHLPQKSREDIQNEIRSTIEDMLDDRFGEGSRNDEQITEMLEELGPPKKVAASYQPEKYLIGPKNYGAFIQILRIVLIAVTGAYLLGMSVSFWFSDTEQAFTESLMNLVNSLPGLFSGLVTSFGILVLVFAIIERTRTSFESEEEEWHPDQLPSLEEPEPFSSTSQYWEIGFTVAALILLNLYPQWAGIFSFEGDNWTFIPLLAPSFALLLPLLNLRWALGIGLNSLVLQRREWTTSLRWAKILLVPFDLYILYSIVFRTPILGLNPEYLAFHGLTNTDVGIYEQLLPLITNALNLGLMVAFIVVLVTTIIEAYKLARPNQTLPQVIV